MIKGHDIPRADPVVALPVAADVLPNADTPKPLKLTKTLLPAEAVAVIVGAVAVAAAPRSYVLCLALTILNGMKTPLHTWKL